METAFRFRNNATTSAYIGFTNLNPNGTTFETAPTIGCYFIASSTKSNWQALCSTSATVLTIVDTGFASTTNPVSVTSPFYRFRIELDNTTANFYIQASTTGEMKQVARITTTYPNTTQLNPGIHLGRVGTAGTNSAINFFDLRVWWRTPLGDF
jgi:hypothetical protein